MASFEEFEDFVRERANEIHSKTLEENQEAGNFFFETKNKREKLEKKLEDKEYQDVLLISYGEQQIARVCEIECYHQGFADGFAAMMKCL